MLTPVETVRSFYSAIGAGDTSKMVELMTSDIEWISVVDFNVQEKGPLGHEESVRPTYARVGKLFAGTVRVSCRRFNCRVSGPLCLHPPRHAQTRRSSIRPCMGCSGRKNLASPSVSRYDGTRGSSARLGLAETHRRSRPHAPPFVVSFAQARET
jgi:hypothetical protein